MRIFSSFLFFFFCIFRNRIDWTFFPPIFPFIFIRLFFSYIHYIYIFTGELYCIKNTHVQCMRPRFIYIYIFFLSVYIYNIHTLNLCILKYRCWNIYRAKFDDVYKNRNIVRQTFFRWFLLINIITSFKFIYIWPYILITVYINMLIADVLYNIYVNMLHYKNIYVYLFIVIM